MAKAELEQSNADPTVSWLSLSLVSFEACSLSDGLGDLPLLICSISFSNMLAPVE